MTIKDATPATHWRDCITCGERFQAWEDEICCSARCTKRHEEDLLERKEEIKEELEPPKESESLHESRLTQSFVWS
ncbi:MAG TPA: hypothetical protein ENI23_17465 [bacterium]|nr:hypothetical protein [bacterium]